MKKKTAKEIKTLSGFAGVAKLYEVTPPAEYTDATGETSLTKYVVVSAVSAPFTGAETYIFPTNEKGKIVSWGELDGSYRGGLSHVEALENAGYEVK